MDLCCRLYCWDTDLALRGSILLCDSLENPRENLITFSQTHFLYIKVELFYKEVFC